MCVVELFDFFWDFGVCLLVFGRSDRLLLEFCLQLCVGLSKISKLLELFLDEPNVWLAAVEVCVYVHYLAIADTLLVYLCDEWQIGPVDVEVFVLVAVDVLSDVFVILGIRVILLKFFFFARMLRPCYWRFLDQLGLNLWVCSGLWLLDFSLIVTSQLLIFFCLL